jgi:hypothetical protein
MTGVAGYVYMRPMVRFWAAAPYVSAASESKLYMRAIRSLDAGDSGAARELLDSLLRMNEQTLNEYEAVVEVGKRDAVVVAAKDEIARFRRETARP